MTEEDHFQAKRLEAIANKIEAWMKDGTRSFTPEDARMLRDAAIFVDAFHGDPATLVRVQKAFERAEAVVHVGKMAGAVLAFFVVVWINWERLMEMIGMGER